ncbi:MAG TPA: hypothetical protein VMS18_21550 [Candidatus Binatia bacterium]|nr:hypothetical protein [Candidatus Binatia bacterium]
MQSQKPYLLIVLMAAVAASLAIPAAQAQDARAVVSVPFDFSVGGVQFQAGDYRIRVEGELGSFLMLARSGGDTKYSMLLPEHREPLRNGEPYLVFHRYGTEAFLTRVVFSNGQTYDLPRTSREKELLAGATSNEQVDLSMGSSR